MGWEPQAEWARSAEQLANRWLENCRKFSGHKQFFRALGWGPRLCRLFVVAGVRAAVESQLNARSRSLLEVVEARADEAISEEALLAELNAITQEIVEVNRQVIHEAVWNIASMAPVFAAGYLAKLQQHRELFGKILAAMVGPGWKWSDDWKTGTVVRLAGGIYDQQEWDVMPILADALQDAGCDEVGVLRYCRGTGPFFRGCWVLDVILSKRDTLFPRLLDS